MRKRELIITLSSIFLILVMLITSCTQTAKPTPVSTPTPTAKPAAATSTPTSTPTPTTKVEYKDTVYRVLNPVGAYAAVNLSPLAPRIDGLAGKTIAFLFAEGSPIIMPALWERVQKEFPTTKWVYTESRSTSAVRLTADQQKTVQAAIAGNAW